MSSKEESIAITIDGDQEGSRLDAALAAASGLSRNHLQQLIKEKRVLDASGNSISQGSKKVFEGDRYVIDLPPLKGLNLEAEAIDLDILFEDEHLIVINKPAGMVVHPSHGHDSGTLVHALLHHCESLPGINGMERPGIVHRLDKDTSGSLVVAKSEAAHRGLSAMFASHDLDRKYMAWCRGTPSWKVKHIELPIGRHPIHRQKMAVVEDGREAITDVEVQRLFGPFCQVELTLHTGRTHQIRVHLAHEQLPILGDPTYARNFNPGNVVPEPSRSLIRGLKRQALHARLLAFAHPITGEAMQFSAPLPPELDKLDRALKHNYA